MKVTIDKEIFGKKLLKWWKENQRKFPWRNTRDTYQILISEIMLHRTKADQVVPVYNEFLKRFPTIDELSRASVNDVKKMLYSLGLHWRSEFLHRTAKEIRRKHGGRIPSDKEELEMLPGISQYIASAVRCFSFGYPETLLDTNTVRVLGRLFGIKVSDGSRRSRHFRELYRSLIDVENPREFNYAMIDLGALVCTPKDPLCKHCPIRNMCQYASQRYA